MSHVSMKLRVLQRFFENSERLHRVSTLGVLSRLGSRSKSRSARFQSLTLTLRKFNHAVMGHPVQYSVLFLSPPVQLICSYALLSVCCLLSVVRTGPKQEKIIYISRSIGVRNLKLYHNIRKIPISK